MIRPMTHALVLFVMCWLSAASVKAQDVPLVADLANHLVAITTGFTGTNVLLFGATNGPGDIVVVVRGPAKDEVVRRKDRFGPIWANASAIVFHDVPSYYRVASNRPLDEFVPEALLESRQIGANAVRMPTRDVRSEAEIADFRAALMRLKAEQNLYGEVVGNVTQMSNRLFRTELYFPANVPTGTYMVEVYLFREGQITSAEIVPLTISKIGVGADIFDFAHGKFAFLYGLVMIMLAGSAGWVASAVFRRV